MTGYLVDSATESPYNLEDSSYELIQEPALFPSDDEDAYTESLASTDEINFDDNGSLIGPDFDINRYKPTQIERKQLEQSNTSERLHQQDVDQMIEQSRSATPDSHENAGNYQNSRHGKPVLLTPDSTLYHRSHIKSFGFEECERLLGLSGIDTADLFVSQRMSTDYLRLTKPFRVLLLGNPPKEAEETILSKLASTLAVSADVKFEGNREAGGGVKFNVIPVSDFGSQLSPEVELIENSGIEFILDRCVSLKPYAKSKSVSDAGITIVIEGCPSIHLSNFVKENEIGNIQGDERNLPDLLIFCHSAIKGQVLDPRRRNEKETFLRARKLALSQGLSVLDISLDVPELGNSSLSPMPSRNLHLVIEGSSNSTEMVELSTSPITLEIFANMESVYLNRHLAYISTNVAEEITDLLGTEDVHDQLVFGPNMFNQTLPTRKRFRTYWHQIRGRSETRRMLHCLLAVIFAMSLGFAIVNGLGYRNGDVMISDITHETKVEIPRRNSLSHMQDVHASEATTQALETRSHLDILSLPAERAIRSQNSRKSDNADPSKSLIIHGVDKNQLIFNPLNSFASPKYDKPLLAEARRGSELVKCKVTKRPDGYFLVELDRSKAYGILNVTIWTETHPKFKVNQIIDLGYGWFAATRLMAVAKGVSAISIDEIKRGQRNVAIAMMYGKDMWDAGLHTAMFVLTEKLESVHSSLENVHQRLKKRSNHIRKSLLQGQRISRLLDLKRVYFQEASIVGAVEILGRTWSCLREKLQTDPRSLESSALIKDARQNAIRGWKKVAKKARFQLD